MASALPPLCPRPNERRRPSESSIDSLLSRTSTFSTKSKTATVTTKSEGVVYLSKNKSISTENIRMNVAPFVSGSYLHRYDDRMVTLQKVTQDDQPTTKHDQVQKGQEEKSAQSELANTNHAQEHAMQQQDFSLLKHETPFEKTTTAISTKTEDIAMMETIKTENTKIRTSFEHDIEPSIQLDMFQVSLLHRYFVSIPSDRRPKIKSPTTNKKSKLERLMVRNSQLKSTCQTRSTSNHQQQVNLDASRLSLKRSWTISNSNELSAPQHRFKQTILYPIVANHCVK